MWKGDGPSLQGASVNEAWLDWSVSLFVGDIITGRLTATYIPLGTLSPFLSFFLTLLADFSLIDDFLPPPPADTEGR